MNKLLSVTRHLFVWAMLIVFSNSFGWNWQGFSVENSTMLIPSLYGTAINAGLVYANVFYLYPARFNTLGRYLIISSALIITASIFEAGIDMFYSNHIGILEAQLSEIQRDIEMVGSGPVPGFVVYLFSNLNFALNNLMVHSIFWLLSFAYILPEEREKHLAINQKLKHEKIQAELNFYKAQINPHSLFNGINNIYHIIDQDKEKAKEVLLKFSDVLRYQIYEISKEQVYLRDEIKFLEKYFFLEILKKEDSVLANFEYGKSSDSELNIAPLLFIPFIENAFKHVSRHEKKEKNQIDCSLEVHQSTVLFSISNTVQTIGKSTLAEYGGIGISNITNRLNLLYADKHQLEIVSKEDLFTVTLQVECYE